jgi:hypothetical protein
VKLLYPVAIQDANGTNDVGKTTMFMYRLKHDRLGELNQYTGDGAKQKIKTVPAILLNIEC